MGAWEHEIYRHTLSYADADAIYQAQKAIADQRFALRDDANGWGHIHVRRES